MEDSIDGVADNFIDSVIADWKMRGFSESDINKGMTIINALMRFSVDAGPVIREPIFIESMHACANALEIIRQKYAEN